MSIREQFANYLWNKAKSGLPEASDQHSLYLYNFLPLADELLTYLKAEIEKCLLTDEEIEQIYFECGELNKPSLHYLNERLAQAQVRKMIELLEEK